MYTALDPGTRLYRRYRQYLQYRLDPGTGLYRRYRQYLQYLRFLYHGLLHHSVALQFCLAHVEGPVGFVSLVIRVSTSAHLLLVPKGTWYQPVLRRASHQG
eukprot:SAG31_NODE_23126_length_510_cov_1.435523_1_plen_100_part_01